MGTLFQDLRIALRGLKKSLTFTFIVTLSIGLAIGANTTIFTWMENLILNPFPLVADADRLVALNTTNPDGGASGAPPISGRNILTGARRPLHLKEWLFIVRCASISEIMTSK